LENLIKYRPELTLICQYHYLITVDLNLLDPWTIFLKKYRIDHSAMLTPHEQLVETALHIDQWTQCHIQI